MIGRIRNRNVTKNNRLVSTISKQSEAFFIFYDKKIMKSDVFNKYEKHVLHIKCSS